MDFPQIVNIALGVAAGGGILTLIYAIWPRKIFI